MRFPAAQFTAVVLILLGESSAVAAIPETVHFNEHVRPILSNNCFYCHGPDEKHREADLRLDEREAAIEYGALVPGNPEESLLLARVVSHDPDQVMPPPHSKKPRLTEEQVAVLRRWIEQGAEYEGHWAFLPLSNAAPPTVRQATWPENAIDRWILARLEQEGISPSPKADRATLIRRVSLDLIGLLPSPEEVANFVADPDPNAYERLVERLLASPHFGERWGRHWLDQARYADSNGYTIDSPRAMWPYRDWVIQAVNDDQPFDQFTIEQLAGDLLPDATKRQLIATAFHRNTLINEEGGTDPQQFRHEAVVDRVNTTGAVWLGLTVGCAQCHTHKFDPISHREYYELFAFLNQATDVNNRGATVRVARGELFGVPPSPPTTASDAELAKRQAAWEQTQLAKLDAPVAAPVVWTPVKYREYETHAGASFQLLEDGSLLSSDQTAPKDTYRVVVETTLPRVAAVRLRTLTHESLPKTGPGRAGNGNFVLTGVTLTVAGQKQTFAAAYADHEQPGYAAAGAIDSDPKTGWAINVGPNATAKMNADHEAILTLTKPVDAAGQLLELELRHELNDNYLVGRFAVDVAENSPPAPPLMSAALVAALRTSPEKRTPQQAAQVKTVFEQEDPAAMYAKRIKEEAAVRQGDVMVMKELDKPRATYIYQRGDFLRPDTETGPLKPDVLDAVSPTLPESDHRTRLDLARWLVDPANPLTPRVTMNRVWMRYFGRGLVETEEDFGAQGAPPTHPDLLDWLAGELIRRGWSLKAMHRLIVMSATYRQSSKARPDLLEKDPRNLLLARQERVRVEAEIVRDAALSASGLLSPTLGGPGVRPPQPEGVYAFTQNAKPWTPAADGDRYRRAMYTLFFRSAPHPMFTTFDAPDFQSVCTRRLRSNTPLQALTVANDQAFLEFAQGLAARVSREVPSDDAAARLRRLFQLCLCREPSAKELSILQDYYQRQVAEFAAHPERAQPLVPNWLAQAGAPEVAAALVCASRAVLNTDSFITRE